MSGEGPVELVSVTFFGSLIAPLGGGGSIGGGVPSIGAADTAEAAPLEAARSRRVVSPSFAIGGSGRGVGGGPAIALGVLTGLTGSTTVALADGGAFSDAPSGACTPAGLTASSAETLVAKGDRRWIVGRTSTLARARQKMTMAISESPRATATRLPGPERPPPRTDTSLRRLRDGFDLACGASAATGSVVSQGTTGPCWWAVGGAGTGVVGRGDSGALSKPVTR